MKVVPRRRKPTRKRASAIRFALIATAVLVLFIAIAVRLPDPAEKPTSSAPSPAVTEDTRLGRILAEPTARHPGQSGILPLRDPHDAFAARYLLAHAAERSLDVQSYIWGDDLTGALMFEALHQAAERGVRVRLLLDDNGTARLDEDIAALDGHPNISVRLFNPFAIRFPKSLNYFTEFSRLNRRMHNKSLTADNQATIVGGRNVADEYFAAGSGRLFADLDVLAVGRVVGEVSADFDRYWNSEAAWPARALIGPGESGALERLRKRAEALKDEPGTRDYLNRFDESAFTDAFVDGRLSMTWSRVHVVSDPPDKVLDRARPDSLLSDQLEATLGLPERQLLLVSPYFVPGADGAAFFADLARRGVDVRILTNALEATDVAAVHSGYAKHRKTLLDAGVQLFEMQRLSGAERRRGTGPFGSSGSSLHAKTFAVDGERVFVGSFNFDPRSLWLNTELGLVIDSPALAAQVADVFDGEMLERAFEVRLDADGRVIWLERTDQGTVRHDQEPHTSAWKRFWVAVLSRLPIAWLL
jgi:putative cardiolipin synthase